MPDSLHALLAARLAASDSDQAAAGVFAAAVSDLRGVSTPSHLAHGLLDHAQHLIRLGDAQAAEAAAGEGRDLAHSLRCQPLLDRVADITPAQPHIRA